MKLNRHQLDMVTAISKVPNGEEFRVKDIKNKFGYPHKDAASVLQQYAILGVFVKYAPKEYHNGAIYYVKNDMFDFYYSLLTI